MTGFLKRWRGIAIAVGALALASWVWSPAFEDLDATGFGDWQMIHHNWEAGWVALTRHGEWPLWDPYHCGGVPILGNPETQHFSPLFFLSFLVGTTVAIKLFLLLHAAAGFAGMYLLGRRAYALHPAGALLAAVSWGASGFFAWHGSGGHGTFLPFFFAPWLLLAWRRAVEDPRWSVAVAGILTLVVFEGGTYPFPYLSLLLAFDALVLLRDPDRRVGVVRAALVAGPLTLLLAAIRLLPIRETLDMLPRTVESTDSLELYELVDMLTATEHAYRWGHTYVWAEYGTYVGWGVVLLALAGLWVAWKRGPGWRHLIVGLLFFGALVLGNRGSFHPWPILHSLPVYDSLRVPSRFAVLFTIFLALLAGLAVDRLVKWLGSFRLRRELDWTRLVLPWLVVLPLTYEVVDGNWTTVDRFDWAPVDISEPAPRFHLVPARNYIRLYASFPRQNLGTPACYVGGMNWRVSNGLWLGDVPQVRFRHAEGEAVDWGRTNNTVWAEVQMPSEGWVVFNQNWFPGWKTNVGRLFGDEGRLAVEVPAGRHRIELRYAPDSLPLGGSLSLLGLLLAVLVGRFGTAERFARPAAWVRDRLGVERTHEGEPGADDAANDGTSSHHTSSHDSSGEASEDTTGDETAEPPPATP